MVICNQTILDTILNIVVPIFTLFLGMLFIPLAESFKENYRLNKLKIFIIHSLKQVSEQIDIQASRIKDTLDIIEDFNNNNLFPIKNSVFSLHNILETEASDLYKVLVNKRKGKDEKLKIKDYKDVTNFIYFFSETLPLIFETCQKGVSDLNMFTEDWNQSQLKLQGYINEIVSIAATTEINIDDDKLFSEIISVKEKLKENYDENNPNVENFYLEFVRPIIQISKKYPKDKMALVLMRESQSSRLAYEQIKVTRKRVKNYLQTSYDNIVESNIKLKRIIDNIN